MYELHEDFTVVEEAKKWCLELAKGTGSATLIAKVILNKYNCNEFPIVIDLQLLVATLDPKRLQLAIGVLLYSYDSMGEWEEIKQLKELYLDN
jgi:hypothetical protein